MNDLIKGKVYEHYKGGLYLLRGIAILESDASTNMAIYESMETGVVWTRPVDEFVEKFLLRSSVSPRKGDGK